MPPYTDIHSTGLADKLAGKAMFLENASVVLTVCSDVLGPANDAVTLLTL
jgi:hypothetical protein